MRQITLIRIAVCLMFLTTVFTTIQANTNRFASVEEYITQHRDFAVSEMHRVRLPASITLAQAILESSFGNSYLARQANNHFGIKCHDWAGAKVYKDDDAKDECFRSYSTTYESFVDHSEFLQRSRYASLYNLDIYNYKAWAKGLRKAGYATNPAYAEKLIAVIERYNLNKYDVKAPRPMIVSNDNEATYTPNTTTSKTQTTRSKYEEDRDRWDKNRKSGKKKSSGISLPGFGKKSKGTANRGEVFYFNRIKTVVTTKNTPVKQLASIYQMELDKFCRFNDFTEDQIIPANTKIYLQPKRNQGPFSVKTHKVKIGETMKDIAQTYGIKEDKLYKKNFMRLGQRPAPGETIYLRGKAPRPPKLVTSFYAPKDNPKTPENDPKKDRYEYKPIEEKSTVDLKKLDVKTDDEDMDDVGMDTNVEDVEASYIPSDLIEEVEEATIFDIEEEEVVKPQAPKVKVPATTTTTVVNKPKTPTKPKVMVPTKPTVETPAPVKKSPKSVTTTSYIVQKGDTLYSISKKTGTSVEMIKKMNGMDSNVIKLGQELIVPQK